ncbi:hypothetical protein NMY22_g10811 [Coprinellus aureogranulatus]|nr:hypothetical protein NMY22_g10811 [Coprinellus aureogranulatus]
MHHVLKLVNPILAPYAYRIQPSRGTPVRVLSTSGFSTPSARRAPTYGIPSASRLFCDLVNFAMERPPSTEEPDLIFNGNGATKHQTISIMPDSAIQTAKNIDITTVGRDLVSNSRISSKVDLAINVVVNCGDSGSQPSASTPLKRVEKNSSDGDTTVHPEGGERDSEVTPQTTFSMWDIIALFSNIIAWNFGGASLQQELGDDPANASLAFTVGSMDDSIEWVAQRPGRAFHEIYVLSLLNTGYGLPCWEPAPSLPDSQPQGVVPGDVGTYTTEGGFEKTFNLWEVSDRLENTYPCCGSTGASQPLAGRVGIRRNAVHEGAIFSLGASCRSKPHRALLKNLGNSYDAISSRFGDHR